MAQSMAKYVSEARIQDRAQATGSLGRRRREAVEDDAW